MLITLAIILVVGLIVWGLTKFLLYCIGLIMAPTPLQSWMVGTVYLIVLLLFLVWALGYAGVAGVHKLI